MRIALCDDDQNWLDQSEKIIKDFGKKNNLDMELRCFREGEALLSWAGEPPEVLFLDIQFDTDKNGMDIASQVNAEWPDSLIIYLTDYLKYATHVYHTEHVFYILKNEFAPRIGEVFRKIFHELEQKQKMLIFHLNKGGSVSLYPREILFFERRGRLTEINTVSGTWCIKDPLAEVEKQLPDIDFVRCHQSYIVYFPAILEYHKKWFILKNSERIEISRSYWNRCGQAFLRWSLMQTE
ncbi:MAG: LytTR family DNA-binding domain-containing protein [Lachnospiraceae bacterium]|nr:LytTR family DNA-binding domain-containing protein [Lachnospiraceae bacterium]